MEIIMVIAFVAVMYFGGMFAIDMMNKAIYPKNKNYKKNAKNFKGMFAIKMGI